MLALISPAKTLDYKSPLPPLSPTAPRFAAEAETLAAAAGRLGARRLGDLMHISEKLAALNADRFRNFAEAPERPAIHAYAGDVYAGFEVRTLDDAAVAFAQDHLRILSGLYGLLRPLDAIRPHRLEMGTRWAPRRKALTDWWGERIGRALGDDLAGEGSGEIVNLASQEYWAAIAQAPPPGARIITVDFREATADGGTRFNSFGAKRARGMMARYLCEHRIDRAEGLKGFDSDGYEFDADGSAEDRWLFVRRAG